MQLFNDTNFRCMSAGAPYMYVFKTLPKTKICVLHKQRKLRKDRAQQF